MSENDFKDSQEPGTDDGRDPRPDMNQEKDYMPKPICLITGATDGVGKATAIELAKKGFTVVLAARSAAKAEALKQEIAKVAGNTDADYIVADLASLQQTRALAESFKRRY